MTVETRSSIVPDSHEVFDQTTPGFCADVSSLRAIMTMDRRAIITWAEISCRRLRLMSKVHCYSVVTDVSAWCERKQMTAQARPCGGLAKKASTVVVCCDYSVCLRSLSDATPHTSRASVTPCFQLTVFRLLEIIFDKKSSSSPSTISELKRLHIKCVGGRGSVPDITGKAYNVSQPPLHFLGEKKGKQERKERTQWGKKSFTPVSQPCRVCAKWLAALWKPKTVAEGWLYIWWTSRISCCLTDIANAFFRYLLCLWLLTPIRNNYDKYKIDVFRD